MRLSVRAMGGGVALALTLGACGVLPGDDPEGDPTSSGQGGAVTIGGCQPQNPLVPASTNETCGGNPLDAIFSKLVKYDSQTGEAVDEIASSINSEDNQTWRIELEPGWTFHDGTPITANSFVDAWNWGAHGANAAANSYFYSVIEGFEEVQGEVDEDGNFVPGTATADTMSGLEVIDDSTFEVTLKQPEAGFRQRLGYIAYAPLPETFYGTTPEDFGANPIGSGPFEFVEFVQGERIVLEAYDGYQGDVRPNVGGVTFEIFDSQDAQYASLLSDQVDVMTQLPTSALAGETYKSDLGDRYIEQETGVIHMLGLPSADADPSLSDPRVRQAISMAIDRQLIIDNIFQGSRQPASSWVSPVVDGYSEGQCGGFCTFDPEGARELLAETDFDGEEDELTITYNADGDHETWANATCNNISNVLEIECTTVSAPTLADVLNALGDDELTGMFRIGWQMDYPSIENFLGPLYQSAAGANFFGHDSEQFDNLIAEASGQSGDQAGTLFQEAERVLAQTMPTIPLWFNLTVAGYSTRVDNVTITPFGTVDLLDISVG